MHVLKFEIFRIRMNTWTQLGFFGLIKDSKKPLLEIWRSNTLWMDFFFLQEVQNDFQVASYIMQSNKLQVGGHPAWVQTYLTWGSALEIASS